MFSQMTDLQLLKGISSLDYQAISIEQADTFWQTTKLQNLSGFDFFKNKKLLLSSISHSCFAGLDKRGFSVRLIKKTQKLLFPPKHCKRQPTCSAHEAATRKPVVHI